MIEVMFGEPDRLLAGFIHQAKLFERFMIRLRVIVAGRHFQKIELAEFHRGYLLVTPILSSLGCKISAEQLYVLHERSALDDASCGIMLAVIAQRSAVHPRAALVERCDDLIHLFG